MRIRSRTSRRLDVFDRRFDEMVTPVLAAAGFTEAQPYVFTRRQTLPGEDVIYFDIEGKSFLVFVSFRPPCMDEIDVLYDYQPKEPILGASSYLTPTCFIHQPKTYPCGIASARDHSFRLVAGSFKHHAFEWLDSLRIPVCYADAVPPTMMMYLGRANECAGRFDRAREAYEEQMRCELACWEISSFNAFVKSEGARVFVYLCLKLGREPAKCERVMDAIKFRPLVTRLELEEG